LVAALVHDYGRASVEHVLSGPGLANLFHFVHAGQTCAATDGAVADEDLPARVSENALAGSCVHCVAALEMFVEAYGAEAGNMALRALARAGVYVAGGIAPKILPALERGAFIEAFRFKPPMDDLLKSIPVRVVLNEETALLGAAVRAGQIARGR
jgi:glucokinase